VSQAEQEQRTVVLTRADLPAYCPTVEMGLWNSHPRVYIPLEETPSACCPYCGTRFELREESQA